MRLDPAPDTPLDGRSLERFAHALAEGSATVPVGRPTALVGAGPNLDAAMPAQLAPALVGLVLRCWREERVPGTPPDIAAAAPLAARVLRALHDLGSLALRPDEPARGRLSAALDALPVCATTAESIAVHSVLRAARRWWDAWRPPLQDLYVRLQERSPLTRLVQSDVAVARDWRGTETVLGVPALRPWLVRALLPARETVAGYRAPGAVLDALVRHCASPAAHGLVLDVYDAFFYHAGERMPCADGSERTAWPILARMDRLLRATDTAANAEGAGYFAYFDPLLERFAASPEALERAPYIAAEALQALGEMARRVARASAPRLAFTRAGTTES